MKTLKITLATVMMSFALIFAATMVVNIANPVTVEASTKTDLRKKADAIIKANTNEDDTKTTKLKKLFTFMRDNYGYKNCSKHPNYKPPVKGKTAWINTYALETVKSKKGDCYHFAATYASLAERATGYKTRVVTGTTRGFDKKRKINQPHAWVEINISGKWYVFDVNMDLFGKTTKGAKNPAYTYFKKSRTSTTMKKVYNSFKGVTNFSVDL